jgi:hypothetical protein
MNFQGGSGVLIGTPNVNIDNLTDLSPRPYPVLQEVSCEFKGDTKDLFGQGIFAVDTFDGKVTVSGKGKIIAPPPSLIGPLFFGSTPKQGLNRPVQNEEQAPVATLIPNNPTATINLGVINGDTGDPMSLYEGVGAPPIGSYTFTPASSSSPVTSAAYKFNPSEPASVVWLNYVWPDLVNGETLDLMNMPMGTRPRQNMYMFNKYRGKTVALILNQVVLGSFSIASKLEDHWLSDFDFKACCDFSNKLGSFEMDM